MKQNAVQELSYKFSLRIIRLYQHLQKQKADLVLPRQLLRSGTSIGANVEEAIGALSRADFLARIGIAYKEARETHYWIRLLKDTGIIEGEAAESLLVDAERLKKTLAKIQKTTRNSGTPPNP